MRKKLREYLLSIPQLDAWQREKIIDIVVNIYVEKVGGIVFRTVLYTLLIVLALMYIFN